MKYSYVFGAVALATGTLAQQSIWGQCGGVQWTGPTSCSAGLQCSSLNPYYYQCLSGVATTTTSSRTTSRTTTTTSHTTTTTSRTTTTSSNRTPTTTSSSTTSHAMTTTTSATTTSRTTTVSSGGVTSISGNPFNGKTQYVQPFYASEINNIAIPSLVAEGKSSQTAAAAKVAQVPTFLWFDTIEKAKTFPTYLADIRTKNAAGANIIGTFIVYDLPDRDCAALASNGELSIANGGVAAYKTQYIDTLVAAVKQYSDVPLALIIEPDSLANLVTNLSTAKCANAQSAYLECVTYAIQQLNLPNVSMYLDAGHAGWLGWTDNLGRAATMFNNLYSAAGSPARVRGLATNVANYNAFSVSTCASYTSGDANCDENRYINALAPLLTSGGFPAHFIVDQGRSGKQPTGQQQWGDWCNAIGTGFGMRPGSSVSNSYVDAIVWAKPGGECDGTSNSSAVRFDAHCGYSDALQPAPEAGSWFQAYFEQLLTNANPAF